MKKDVDVEDQGSDQKGLVASLGDNRDDDKDVKQIKNK